MDTNTTLSPKYYRYTLRGVLTTRSLFPNNDKTRNLVRRKKNAKGRYIDKYKVQDRPTLANKIFIRFLHLILNDVADGHIFLFPGVQQANIFLEPIPDEEIKALRQKGYYKDINILKANFKVPRFRIDLGASQRRYHWQVRVTPKIQRKSFRNAENGNLTYSRLIGKI